MVPPITSEEELDEFLSRTSPRVVRALRHLQGDLLILGAGGKMGPSLARLARRAANEAGRGDLRVIAVSRFSSPAVPSGLSKLGIEVVVCDLQDDAARSKLPDAENVLFMFGHKFGGAQNPSQYWATNVYLSGRLAEQYRESRLVAFSTGNVYPLTPIHTPPPTEATPCAPVGEYATTCWGRERMLEYVSRRFGTQVCLLRLNYAVEARYGVPVDLAGRLMAGQPIDLATGYVNVVWQGYANGVALQAFAMAKSPPEVINVTGAEMLSVRQLADGLARRLGVLPHFTGTESETALLSDASRCHELFGSPDVDIEEMLDVVAAWVSGGGRTLDKPTMFQVRDGRF